MALLEGTKTNNAANSLLSNSLQRSASGFQKALDNAIQTNAGLRDNRMKQGDNFLQEQRAEINLGQRRADNLQKFFEDRQTDVEQTRAFNEGARQFGASQAQQDRQFNRRMALDEERLNQDIISRQQSIYDQNWTRDNQLFDTQARRDHDVLMQNLRGGQSSANRAQEKTRLANLATEESADIKGRARALSEEVRRLRAGGFHNEAARLRNEGLETLRGRADKLDLNATETKTLAESFKPLISPIDSMSQKDAQDLLEAKELWLNRDRTEAVIATLNSWARKGIVAENGTIQEVQDKGLGAGRFAEANKYDIADNRDGDGILPNKRPSPSELYSNK